MRISDWSSDVCSSDLLEGFERHAEAGGRLRGAGMQRQYDRAFRRHRFQVADHRAQAGRVIGVFGAMNGSQRVATGLKAEPDQNVGAGPRPLLCIKRGVIHDVADMNDPVANALIRKVLRSEEHTYELQTLMRISYA